MGNGSVAHLIGTKAFVISIVAGLAVFYDISFINDEVVRQNV